jgi:hypothetical protein
MLRWAGCVRQTGTSASGSWRRLRSRVVLHWGVVGAVQRTHTTGRSRHAQLALHGLERTADLESQGATEASDEVVEHTRVAVGPTLERLLTGSGSWRHLANGSRRRRLAAAADR